MWSSLRGASMASLLVVSLSACFELSSDDEEDFVPADAAGVETVVTGVVAKGFAYCDIIVRQPDGTAISESSFRPAGVVVGQDSAAPGQPVPQLTAQDVEFSITVRDYVGPAVVEATNCSFEDETSGQRVDMNRLRAVFEIPETGGDITANVTPLTDLAYLVAEVLAGGTPQAMTPGNVHGAYEVVDAGFNNGDFDILTTVPAIATLETSANADPGAQVYGLILAAFSGAGANPTDTIDGLTDAIMSGGSAEALLILYEGALAFDASQRNRSGRTAAGVVAELPGLADTELPNPQLF